MDEKIDAICATIDGLKDSLQDLLKELRTATGCNGLVFAHNRKYRYQIDVPSGAVHHFNAAELLGESWVSVGKLTAGRKRYVSDKLLQLSRELDEAERKFKLKMVPVIRDMFMRFYSYREHWQAVVNCVAELDALCALALYSSKAGMCRPIFLLNDGKSLEIKGLRHALIEDPNYVANDVSIGNPAKCLVITGPNMGGKSTLLRSTCLAVVLA